MALAYYDEDNPNPEQRGIIMAGVSKIFAVILAFMALAFYVMFATYNTADPSPLQDTLNSPTNAFGYLGAYLSDPLFRLVGQAVWIIPLSLFIWSVRLFMGWSNAIFVNRYIFLPIALLVVAIFCATFSLSPNWHFPTQGMGGAFGDRALGLFVSILPIAPSLSLFLLSLLLGVFAVMAVCYISGIQAEELLGFFEKALGDIRFVALGLVGLIAGLLARTPRNAKTREVETSRTPQTATHQSKTFNLRSVISGENQNGYEHEDYRAAAPEFNEDTSTTDAPKWDNQPRNDARNLEKNPNSTGSLLQKIVSSKVGKHKEMLKFRVDGKQEPHEGERIEPSAPALSGDHTPTNLRREPIVKAPATKKPQMSTKAQAEAQPSFAFEAKEKSFEAPSLSLLQSPETITRHIPPREALEASARQLEAVLDDYGVKGEIVAVRPGPVVTMYELEPAAGLKASRVIGLADDIARSMSALAARVATVPGRSVIGIELPNETREMVLLREIFAAKNYGDTKFGLPLALGKDIAGEPMISNLAKMPHLLIAGTTGSGKSVAINTMILSLLYHASPEDVRMIMIDPKMLELSVYDNIPHLLSPVVTDPKKAVVALKWVVSEMEERYRKMSKMGVRNIDGYNSRVKDALDKGEGFTRTVQTGFDDATGEPVFESEEYAPEKMPYIVVIVDEMADLMMVAGKEIEACIQRLAQMARASGIHLIMATQRPSVDVITGTIKANFPTRISFQVTSKIDSRTILGEMGAEQLLGMGDMLYMSGGGRITRVHAPFVSDEEVEEVVRHLKAQGEPEYVSGVVEGPEDDKASSIDAVLGLGDSGGEDELYDQAVAIVARDRKCSTSYIQRKLSIGYNKAANLVERMEDEGVVSPANHVGKRDVLVAEI